MLNDDSILGMTDSLKRLHCSVPDSRIQGGGHGDVFYCTKDGVREVVSIGNHQGYDLWVPKPKKTFGKLIDDKTCNDFGCSLEQAIAFLEGAPMHVIRSMKSSRVNTIQAVIDSYYADRRKKAADKPPGA